MSLVDFIKGAPTVLQTSDDVYAYGDEIVEISRDNGFWRAIGVAGHFKSAMISEGLYAAMKANGLEAMAASYIHPGLPISDEQTQTNLTLMAEGFRSKNDPAMTVLANACDELKQIGIKTSTRWVQYGMERPSDEDIKAALDEIKRLDWMSNVEMMFNLFRSQKKTIAEIKAEVAAFGG